MKDIVKVMELLKKNNIDFRKSLLYDEYNEICGSALWLEVGHIEFDVTGKIKNVVNY